MSGHDIMAVVSLVVLIGAIVFGFIKKVNVGLLSVGLALIVGKAAGMSDSDIVGGWGTNLFMILLGTTFLFGILQANGTLDLLARKIVAAAGRQARMIPWALFVMGAAIAAVGPGVVPSFAMVAMFAVPLAKAMGLDLAHTLCLTTVGQFGSLAGSLTPLAASGIIATNLSTEIGITGLALPMNICIITVSLIGAIIAYFVMGGYKIKGENPYKLSDLPAFTGKQRLSLAGVLAMVVVVLITSYQIGLVAFAIAVRALEHADPRLRRRSPHERRHRSRRHRPAHRRDLLDNDSGHCDRHICMCLRMHELVQLDFRRRHADAYPDHTRHNRKPRHRQHPRHSIRLRAVRRCIHGRPLPRLQRRCRRHGRPLEQWS